MRRSVHTTGSCGTGSRTATLHNTQEGWLAMPGQEQHVNMTVVFRIEDSCEWVAQKLSNVSLLGSTLCCADTPGIARKNCLPHVTQCGSPCESTRLSCSARCCTCLTSHLLQCLTLRFIRTTSGWALHRTSCLLLEPWMVFKCWANILCGRDKFLKQLVKGIFQIVSIALVHLTVLFGMAQFLILLHNFQD